MDINPSELNDLASVDMLFAEMMVESGVNPIPSVCDGCDMSLLEQDSKTIADAFSRAETNMQTLISALDLSMDLNNKTSIERVINNLREKQQLIANAKQNFTKPGFDFVGLYKDLKKVQNKLGLNLNCPEMNVLSLTEQTFDIDKTANKVMQSAKELDDFMKEGEKEFQVFLNEDREIENEYLSDRIKEKIKENKKRKEMQRENSLRISQTFTRSDFGKSL